MKDKKIRVTKHLDTQKQETMNVTHTLWTIAVQYYEDEDSKGYVANFENGPYTGCIVEGNTLAEALRELATSVEVSESFENIKTP